MQSAKTSNDLFLDNIAKFLVPEVRKQNIYNYMSKEITCVWNEQRNYLYLEYYTIQELLPWPSPETLHVS